MEVRKYECSNCHKYFFVNCDAGDYPRCCPYCKAPIDIHKDFLGIKLVVDKKIEIQIKGVARATLEFDVANRNRDSNHNDTIILLDMSDGNIWVDTIYNFRNDSLKLYNNPAIICLSLYLQARNHKVSA